MKGMNAMNVMRLRFATFSIVGAVGFVAQLAALWLFTERFGLHYLASTAAATEIAILLNFVGHESWTWSDRPAGAREVVRRLFRFHGANGTISLAGGILVMPLLIETGGLHYMQANVLTVGICALANFVAADRVVFTPALGLALALVLAGAAGPSGDALEAAELRPSTLDAFNRYAKTTEARMEGETAARAPFLWIDRLTEADRRQALARLKRGEIVVGRLQTREAGREIDVPDGLIHHWVGTTFVPHATVDGVIALMQGYDRYQDVYAPNVRRSRTIGREGERFTVYLQLFMKKVVSVVLNTENDVRYRRLSDSRAHVRSYSTRIAEVREAGSGSETEAPVGRDGGYLWRFNNYCSVEQQGDGAYVQCESLSLSRSVPMGLGWLVGPFVTSIPRESLEFTLGRMRAHLVDAR
jgi:putative flippase GtrA